MVFYWVSSVFLDSLTFFSSSPAGTNQKDNDFERKFRRTEQNIMRFDSFSWRILVFFVLFICMKFRNNKICGISRFGWSEKPTNIFSVWLEKEFYLIFYCFFVFYLIFLSVRFQRLCGRVFSWLQFQRRHLKFVSI